MNKQGIIMDLLKINNNINGARKMSFAIRFWA